MAGYYTLKQSEKNGEWYFNLKAGNHEIMLQSEGYSSKSGAESGIASVQKNGPDASRYERKESEKGHYWFVLKAANGQTMGMSEMYPTPGTRDKGIASVMSNASTTVIKEL